MSANSTTSYPMDIITVIDDLMIDGFHRNIGNPLMFVYFLKTIGCTLYKYLTREKSTCPALMVILGSPSAEVSPSRSGL